MTAAEVAEMLDVTEKTVRNWMNGNGLPFTDQGRGRKLNWHESLRWYVAYRIAESGKNGNPAQKARLKDEQVPAESYDAALTRKTRAEADLRELELARQRAQVVAIADAKTAMARVASSLRTAILAMPAKLTGQLFGVKERKRIQEILQREAEAQCRRLIALAPQVSGAVDDDA